MLEYQPPVFELANALLNEPLVCASGRYEMPAGEGLGVEIDESRLQGLQS
jgi:galactonate dehydratase